MEAIEDLHFEEYFASWPKDGCMLDSVHGNG